MIVNMIILIFFDIILCSMVYLNVSLYKKYLTPFTVFASIYLVLINLNNLCISFLYGFNQVQGIVLCKMLMLFFVCFATEYIVGYYVLSFNQKRNKKILFYENTQVYVTENNKGIIFNNLLVYWLINIVFFIGIICFIISFLYTGITFGFTNIKGNLNDRFALYAYWAVAVAPIFAIANSDKHKRFFMLSMLTVFFILTFLTASKYVITRNVLYFLFVIIISKKIKLLNLVKIILFIVIFVFFMFVFIYGFLSVFKGEGSIFGRLGAIIKHMFYYLLSPIIANNTSMSVTMRQYSFVPYSVIINQMKMWQQNGDYVSPILPFIFEYANDELVNVSGLLGELHFTVGLVEEGFLLICLFVISDSLYICSLKTGKYYFSNAYLFSINTMLFFCNFYSVHGILFPFFLLILFETCLIIVQKINFKKIYRNLKCKNVLKKN